MTRPGILLVDKPAGPTSHDVVTWVRWALSTREVGHCGTLDPAATGLLVVCLGAATRLSAVLSDADKTYRATIALGVATTTDDAEGAEVRRQPCGPDVAAHAACAALALVGTHALAPPAYSAIRTDGQRAHDRARRGLLVDLDARTMIVRDVRDVGVAVEGDIVQVRATFEVSKGTYVRSLAVELGRRLGVPAHLSALRRLASGALRIDDPRAAGPLTAITLAPRIQPEPRPRFRLRPLAIDARPDDDAGLRRAIGHWLARHRLLPWTGLPVPCVQLSAAPDDAERAQRLSHGQAVELPGAAQGPIAVVRDVAGAPACLVLAHAKDGLVQPRRVVLSAAAAP